MGHENTSTILIVDDNEANRYTLARLLKNEGFNTAEAWNGREGLDRMVIEPDLIIVDVRMPEMDGYEFCRRIKTHPVWRSIPILQISATYTSPSDVAYGLDRGADGYLTHPVDPMVLIATVRAFLRMRRAEAQLQRMQRMEVVGRLAGGFAHETNNQMAVVLGFADYVLRAPGLSTQHRNDVAEMKRAAERVADLTRRLLAFSRRQVLQPQVLNLDMVVAESRAMLQRTLGPDVHIIVDLAPGAKWVQVDRTQLLQVLLNLGLNSRDAMPGGGRLTIATRVGPPPASEGHMARTWRPDEPLAIVSVTDTGTGIEAAVRERIFDPFFSTKGVGEGSGLGLSVVEGIVEQSGGDVWLESGAAGTTFTVGLPLMAEPPVEEIQPAALDIPGGSETILVVDDEEVLRAMLIRGLSEAGYRVLEAGSAAQALGVIAERGEEIDLVIADLAMPGLSGVELARRAAEIHAALPFIFVSGYPLETFDVGYDFNAPFLQKPFPPAALALAVRETLESRRTDGVSDKSLGASPDHSPAST